MAYTTINKSTDYFNTKLYTGNASSRTISGIGFQPDFTWSKNRGNDDNHYLYDAVRGATKYIISDSNVAEGTASGITAWNADGYTLGSSVGINANGVTAVSWNWLADNTSGSSNTDGYTNSTVSVNSTAGFSIVKWTGTGSNTTIGHGLASVPKFIIVKNRSTTANWITYNSYNGNTDYMYLNQTGASASTVQAWNNTSPTSSVISLGISSEVNGSGNDMIAYCFAEKQGYSKIGSFTGNGNADGTFVYTGFKPAWIMYKNVSGTSDWYIQDIKRRTFNVNNVRLEANNFDVEVTGASDSIDILSNGFKLRHSSASFNISGNTYIYMAIGQSLVGSNNVPCTAR